jgi:hypothetical protein
MSLDTEPPASRGFFDLGFRGPDGTLQGGGGFDLPQGGGGAKSDLPPLILGRGEPSTLKWQAAAWVALAAGIFVRQGLQLAAPFWTFANVKVATMVLSLVVALAILPALMRSLNQRWRRPRLAHIAAPFVFGFLLDLALGAVAKLAASPGPTS